MTDMKVIINQSNISGKIIKKFLNFIEKDRLFYLKREKTSFKFHLLNIKEFKETNFEKNKYYLVLDSANFDLKGIKILLKYNFENPITTLIYFTDKNKKIKKIEIDDNYFITGYKIKKEEGYLPSGIYLVNSNCFKDYKDFINYFKHSSLIKNFEHLNKDFNIYCIPYSICKKASLKERNIAFLDRDGILIKDIGYPHKKEHFHLNNEVLPFLKRLQDYNYEFIIITNQSGIARGLFSISTYKKFHSFLEKEFKKFKLKFLDVYFCPYYEHGKIKRYSKKSILRKPYPGMVLKAFSKYNINYEKSFMIGDKESDIIKLPYLSSYLVKGEFPLEENKNSYIFKNFDELFIKLKEEKFNEK